MSLRVPAMLMAAVLAAGACTSGARGSTSTTTTAPSTTTATTTAATRDPGFRTRTKGVLTVATGRELDPFYVSAGGSLVGGLEYDLARAVGAYLGVGVRVVPQPLLSLVTGRDCGCDLYLGQVPATEALARSTDLSEPYLTADQAVLVRAGTAISDAATARAMRWGTELSNAEGVHLVQRQVRPSAPLELYSAGTDLFGALRAGSISAALVDTPRALVAVAADPALTLVGRVQTGGAYAAVLPLGSPNTSALNDLLRRLRDDGTIGLLSRRYLGLDPATVPAIRLS